jgi:hypothetical protein
MGTSGNSVIVVQPEASEPMDDAEAFRSPGGMGDVVTGIQVVGPDGRVKQEWHTDEPSRNHQTAESTH